MDDQEKTVQRSIEAGRAFAQMVERRPEGKIGFLKASARFRAFAAVMRAQQDSLNAAQQAVAAIFDRVPNTAISMVLATSSKFITAELSARREEIRERLIEEARAEFDSECSEWEDIYGVPYPREFDEVIRQAVRAGFTPADLRKNEWTFEELMPYIEGYLLGQKDKRMVTDVAVESSASASVLANPATIDTVQRSTGAHGWSEQDCGEAEAHYISDGTIRILGYGDIVLTRESHRIFVEVLMRDGRKTSGQLEGYGVSNPSRVARELCDLEEGVLKPFIARPGQSNKNVGYAVYIVDSRKS